jgi:hypothetical protein
MSGTAHYDQTPCPSGKFRATIGAKRVSECTACTDKSYCETRGLAAVTSTCLDGYLCSVGSVYSTGLNKQKCEKNKYCLNGVANDCAAGTINTETGSSLATDCINCPPGKICPNHDTGIQDCPAGKYCAEGLSNLASGTVCEKGNYCPTGSQHALKCPAATYQDTLE